MKAKHFYLELKAGEKVVKRIPTSLGSEYRDREHLKLDQMPNQEIFFVASSEKEKVIR